MPETDDTLSRVRAVTIRVRQDTIYDGKTRAHRIVRLWSFEVTSDATDEDVENAKAYATDVVEWLATEIEDDGERD